MKSVSICESANFNRSDHVLSFPPHTVSILRKSQLYTLVSVLRMILYCSHSGQLIFNILKNSSHAFSYLSQEFTKIVTLFI